MFSTVGGSLLLFEYPTVLNTPMVLMISPTCIMISPMVLKFQRMVSPMVLNTPTVLMISPTCIMISPTVQNTPRYSRYPHIYHDIPHGTEHPTVLKISPTVLMISPMVLNTPTVLHTHYTGWKLLENMMMSSM